jgi:hypothetical protein
VVTRHRFRGAIAGVGSTSGVRVVVGRWVESPWGRFADVMVERPDGHRLLLAPTEQVAGLVTTTYTFDEVRLEPVEVLVGDGRGDLPGSVAEGAGRASGSWQVRSTSLSLDLSTGARTRLGRLVRLVPAPVAASPAFATVVDPVARLVMDGVRTRGVARPGRREYYGATDVHAVTGMTGQLDGIPLGALAPVDPPCRFGFSSTPRQPSVTEVVTTIVDLD